MEGERWRAGAWEPAWPLDQAPLHSVHFSPLDMHSEAGVSDSWCSSPPGAQGTGSSQEAQPTGWGGQGEHRGALGRNEECAGMGASWGVGGSVLFTQAEEGSKLQKPPFPPSPHPFPHHCQPHPAWPRPQLKAPGPDWSQLPPPFFPHCLGFWLEPFSQPALD